MAPKHPVRVIQAPRVIDEHRPMDTRLLDVGARKRRGLERHDGDGRVEIDEGSFVLLQLQQVPPARQSTEVTMEDQQQPVPLVIFEAMGVTLSIE
jgi:hypothetical protein